MSLKEGYCELCASVAPITGNQTGSNPRSHCNRGRSVFCCDHRRRSFSTPRAQSHEPSDQRVGCGAKQLSNDQRLLGHGGGRAGPDTRALSGSNSLRAKVRLVLLGAWAAGVLIAMIFPMDPDGAPRTISGTIHETAGPLTFLSLTIGMALVSWHFKQSEKWRSFHRPALILSVVYLAAFLATFLSFVTGSGLTGRAQRIALATGVTWVILVATRLRSVAILA